MFNLKGYLKAGALKQGDLFCFYSHGFKVWRVDYHYGDYTTISRYFEPIDDKTPISDSIHKDVWVGKLENAG